MITTLNHSTSEKRILIVNCPIESYTEYIVSASSFLAQSDLFLSIYIFDNPSATESLRLLSQIPISKIFTSIEWTSLGKETEEHPFGFVIGGHEDGTLSLWDITKILKNIKKFIYIHRLWMFKSKKIFSKSSIFFSL